MSDLMRKEFEVWAESRGMDLYCSRKNIYVESETLWAWSSWKASRECLVIELPPSIGVTPIGGDGIQEFIDCNGEYLHGHLVVDALTAAGVKYK